MKKYKKKTIGMALLASAMLLTACSTSVDNDKEEAKKETTEQIQKEQEKNNEKINTHITLKTLDSLKSGMTKEEIVDVLGEDYLEQRDPFTDALLYRYDVGATKDYEYSFDGAVDEVGLREGALDMVVYVEFDEKGKSLIMTGYYVNDKDRLIEIVIDHEGKSEYDIYEDME